MAEREATAQELFDRFRRWLKERRLPVTRQRDLVARVVFAGGEHLSVEGIERRLREQGAKVGTATVYRSLDMLVESGLVRAHDFGEGFQRYEAISSTGEHGHLICSRCGSVTEFSTERVERILPIIADENGFQHHRHRVEILGLCQRCREADIGALARAGRSV